MPRPVLTVLGLVVLSAAAAAALGPFYVESGTTCGSVLRPALEALCYAEPAAERRTQVLVLLALGLGLALLGLLMPGRRRAARPPASAWRVAVPGLVVVPVGASLVTLVSALDGALYGTSQVYTGLPQIHAPSALAGGALLAAVGAHRLGLGRGAALTGASLGLALLMLVQIAVEAVRWDLTDVPTPLLLSGPFASGNSADLASTVTVLAAVPLVPLALGLAARSRREVPPLLGVLLLGGVAALFGAVLAADDSRAYDVGLGALVLLAAPVVVALGVLRAGGRPSGTDPSPDTPVRPARPAAALAVGLVVSTAGAGLAVAAPPGPDVVLDHWDTAGTPTGRLTHVFGPVLGNGCLASTGVAVAGARTWTSTDRCVGREAGVGDLPRHVAHALRPDGSTDLLPAFPAPPGEGVPRVVAASGSTVYALDAAGSVLALADGAPSWQVVVPGGPVHTGDGGPAVTATAQRVVDVAVDGDGLLVAERNAVRRIDAAGLITTVAGTNAGSPTDSPTWGRGTQLAGPELAAPVDASTTRLPDLTGLVAAPDGGAYLLAADTVLRLSPDGTLSTLVGPDPRASSVDPAVRLARQAVASGGGGTVLRSGFAAPGGVVVVDGLGGRLLQIGLDGSVTRLAGGDVSVTGSTTGPLSFSAPPFGPDGDRLRGPGLLPFPEDAALLPGGDVLVASSRVGLLRLGR